jgi:hypothetical protein
MGLEITWPSGAANESERGPKDFSAKAAAGDE